MLYVAEMEPSIGDDIVLQRANEHTALLVTEDKDFGELLFRQGLVHRGVVIVRLGGLSAGTKGAHVSQVFGIHGAEMSGAFTVISPGMVRIRSPLPSDYSMKSLSELWHAIEEGDEGAVRRLLSEHPELVEATGKYGESPLMRAASCDCRTMPVIR